MAQTTFYSVSGIDAKNHTLTGTYSWNTGGVSIGSGAAFSLDGVVLNGIIDGEADVGAGNYIATRAWTRTYVESKVTAAVKFKGSRTWSQITALASADVGDLYNVTDSFTLGGKTYDAGTNVVCKQAFSSAITSYADYWDTYGSATVDLTNYLTKTEAASTYIAKTDVSESNGVITLNY